MWSRRRSLSKNETETWKRIVFPRSARFLISRLPVLIGQGI